MNPEYESSLRIGKVALACDEVVCKACAWKLKTCAKHMSCSLQRTEDKAISWERMATQPAANNARPPTVQIRGQPVNQKSGCCST